MKNDIIIRKLETSDAVHILDWMNDEDIMKNFRINKKNCNMDSVLKFINDSYNDENIHFAISDLSNQYIGTISLKNINLVNMNAEYAIVLKKEFHGKGIAKQASKLILKFGFEDLKLEKIYLNVLSKNERAIELYKSLGFNYEGTFKKHVKIKFKLEDINWFAMQREEFNYD